MPLTLPLLLTLQFLVPFGSGQKGPSAVTTKSRADWVALRESNFTVPATEPKDSRHYVSPPCHCTGQVESHANVAWDDELKCRDSQNRIDAFTARGVTVL